MTIGAIDPEQRRVAERLVLAALRKFHREQPLSVDLRIDSLVTRVRAAAGRKPPPRHRGATPLTLDDAELRRVIDEMADDGRLARNGRRVGLPAASPGLDPEMAARVERLMEGLRSAGADPPRVDALAGTARDPTLGGRPAARGGHPAAGRAGYRLSVGRVVVDQRSDRRDVRTDDDRPPARRAAHQPPACRGDPGSTRGSAAWRPTTRGAGQRPSERPRRLSSAVD